MSVTTQVVFGVWIVCATLLCLGLCYSAARPIPHPEPSPIGPTAIGQPNRQRCPSVICALASPLTANRIVSNHARAEST
jgi:hypothetical protein